jgi:hypothetical protein
LHDPVWRPRALRLPLAGRLTSDSARRPPRMGERPRVSRRMLAGRQNDMSRLTLPEVANRWLNEAQSGVGALPEGTAPASWVVSRLLEWFEVEVAAQLADAARAAAAVRATITAAGGWTDSRIAPAMDELTHLDDSLADLAFLLGLTGQNRLTGEAPDGAVARQRQSEEG